MAAAPHPGGHHRRVVKTRVEQGAGRGQGRQRGAVARKLVFDGEIILFLSLGERMIVVGELVVGLQVVRAARVAVTLKVRLLLMLLVLFPLLCSPILKPDFYLKRKYILLSVSL